MAAPHRSPHTFRPWVGTADLLIAAVVPGVMLGGAALVRRLEDAPAELAVFPCAPDADGALWQAAALPPVD